MKENKLENLMEEMKADLLPRPISRDIWKYYFNNIPTIRSCKIELKRLNALLATAGIKRRLKPKIEFKETSAKSMNRYIQWQCKRAERAIDTNNSELFWTIAKYTTNKSNSFLVSAFNSTFPGWWHSMSIGEVYKCLRKTLKILRTNSDDLEYNRVYIPKGDSDFRPLGVPIPEWRVVMHLHNKWITLFVRREVSKYNHAYLPGKGTTTAWKEMINKVLDKKYIYEFDLKQFFPSVDIEKVTEILQASGVPKGYTYWLENINRCTPKLPKDLKLDESRVTEKIKLHSELKSGIPDINSIITRDLQDPIYKELCKEDGYENLFEWVQAQWAALDHYGIRGFHGLFRELPQGLNTSPILSILTMQDWVKKLWKQGINIILYADDGLLYADTPFHPVAMEGIEFNTSKSGWVKEDGKWNKELKFLGLKYNPSTDLLEGNTRKGSKLTFTKTQESIFGLLNSLDGSFSKQGGSQLKALANSSLLGVFQSKLYNGSWTEEKHIPKDWLLSKKSWWGNRRQMKGHKTASSEACAFLSNAITIIRKDCNKSARQK